MSLTPAVCQPIIIDTDGIFATLPTGSIINAGGTSSSTFTVGGKSLLFTDGTSSGTGAGITLQTVYNSTPNINGQAGITLTISKDFVINDANNSNYFKVASADGTVTINGDLIVNGAATTINTTIIQSDHQLISPASPAVTALSITPSIGVTPIVDLVTVRNSFGAVPVFRIDLNGNLIATQNVTISGLINGINLTSLSEELTVHVAGGGYYHNADALTITPISGLSATTVQQALEALYTDILAINVDGGCSDSSHQITAFGYDYVQASPATSWAINHGGGTLLATVTVYDSTNNEIIPDSVVIIDMDNVLVTFTSPLAGSALVVLVPTSQFTSPLPVMTPGTYTNATVTVTSSGEITAIADGNPAEEKLYVENPQGEYISPSVIGTNAVAIGLLATAQGNASIALGEQAYSRIPGGIVHANGQFAASGDAQVGRYVLRAISGGNTPVQGFMDGSEVGLTLLDNSTWTFKITVTAQRIDSPAGWAGFGFNGVIYRTTGAASTTIQGSINNTFSNSPLPWSVSITADIVNGALAVNFTGETNKIIRWVALVETVEVVGN